MQEYFLVGRRHCFCGGQVMSAIFATWSLREREKLCSISNYWYLLGCHNQSCLLDAPNVLLLVSSWSCKMLKDPCIQSHFSFWEWNCYKEMFDVFVVVISSVAESSASFPRYCTSATSSSRRGPRVRSTSPSRTSLPSKSSQTCSKSGKKRWCWHSLRGSLWPEAITSLCNIECLK